MQKRGPKPKGVGYVNVYWDCWSDMLLISTPHVIEDHAKESANPHLCHLTTVESTGVNEFEVHWDIKGFLIINDQLYGGIQHPWIRLMGMEATVQHLTWLGSLE